MLLLDALATAVAKVVWASTVAQVATGLGLTVAGVTGSGADGVLPGPVQDGVAGAIEAVTPFDVPDSADAVASPVTRTEDDPASPTTIPALPTTTAPAGTEATEHVELEPEDDGGVHQHRGGRETTTPAVPTAAVEPTSGRDHPEDDDPADPSTVDAPEIEDTPDIGDDAGGHHGGDDSGGSGASGGEDSSGHGGGDD
jgi:hypothetical protein